MTSTAKIAANQRNAAHSTGPTSDAGKAASSRNASKHGLTSKDNIILPGQESLFAEFEADLRRDLNPSGPLQQLLFDTILHAAWNVRRCRHFLCTLQVEAADPTIDVLHDNGQSDKLHRVEMYRRRHESSFHRACKELRTLQQEAAYRDATGQGRDLSVLINTSRLPKPNTEAAPPAQEEVHSNTKEHPKPSTRTRKPAVDLPPFVAAHIAEYRRSLDAVREAANMPTPSLRYQPRRP